MRKNISVTNEKVLKAMDQSENASKLIEIAMIYYLESIEADYVTREELEQLNKKVCILNENYTRTVQILSQMANYMKIQ